MPGSFDCESLAKMLDAPSHNVRQALQTIGVDIAMDDTIPVEVFDKSRDKIQKALDEQAKERLDAKKARESWADDKAKWLKEHNAKVGAPS
jgi:hypothetical protein